MRAPTTARRSEAVPYLAAPTAAPRRAAEDAADCSAVVWRYARVGIAVEKGEGGGGEMEGEGGIEQVR